MFQSSRRKGGGEIGGTRSIPIDAGSIEVQYLLKVNQIEFDKAAEPACVREHIGSDFDRELPTLTAYAFWQMVDEVGFKEEQDVPHPRKPLGYVPRFPEMLQNNGPLLASKIRMLLDPLPVDPVLICADEGGAIALTNCIGSFVTCSIIRIPRKVIDEIPLTGDLPSLRQDIGNKSGAAEWYKSLASASGKGSARAILIDEFTSSGGTFQRLSRICASLDLPVERSVVLADFGTDQTVHGLNRDSLYKIPLGDFP